MREALRALSERITLGQNPLGVLVSYGKIVGEDEFE
jgi:hypothetical protein